MVFEPCQKIKSPEEIKKTWAKRLSKLSNISIDEALMIAQDKLDYKNDQVKELEIRQFEKFSRKRETLINKLERSNPLRRISDESHAQNILAASNRHNKTNYERLLDEARELVEAGELQKCEVKDYARKHYKEY